MRFTNPIVEMGKVPDEKELWAYIDKGVNIPKGGDYEWWKKHNLPWEIRPGLDMPWPQLHMLYAYFEEDDTRAIERGWLDPDLAKVCGIDLTNFQKGDIINIMTNSKDVASLIPMADVYLKNGMNVLLMGPHGTGKTASILELAEREGLNFKYYSCSTLDPYTDLVGVPVPQVDEEGHDYLKMVRPREVDEAELILFDEFNRADPKTMNAVFEIIQFKSINGEPLPNLRACWAAMNPPDEDMQYDVEQVDPALLDRFDVYIEVNPKPSVAYMAQRMPEEVAVALKMWWDAHERALGQKKEKDKSRMDYVSPRRLEKIGLVWEATHNPRSVKQALPPGGIFDEAKLINVLKAASGGKNFAKDGAGIGDMANPEFTYTPTGILDQKQKVADYLKKNPNALETHREVADALSSSVGGVGLVKQYGIVLDALDPKILEGFVAAMPPVKQSQMRGGFKQWHKDNRKMAGAAKNLYKVLQKGAKPGNLPTI